MQQLITSQNGLVISGKRYTISQKLSDCTQIVFFNCIFDDIYDYPAIDLKNCTQVTIVSCIFTNVRSAIYAYMSTGIQVMQCSARHIMGPKPRGQFVQFNRVTGDNNKIVGNHVQSVHASCPVTEWGQEDLISLYKSYGTGASPILVACNTLIGPSKSNSSAGICMGDNGGAHQTVTENYIYDVGGTGVTCAGGEHMRIVKNVIASKALPNNRVAIDINNYSASKGTVMRNILVQGNRANFLTSSGKKYGFWNGMRNSDPPIVTEVNNEWNTEDPVAY